MHFTYRDSRTDLEQGDVLQKTPELTSVIREVHPYYLKSDYQYFLVLTQSCDLVNRDAGIKCAYITLAAVRPLSVVIEREAKLYQTNEVLRRADVVGARGRDAVRRLLERLLNNNEPEYFYLHEEPTLGIPEHCCAFLRLSVAVKTQHYEVCRNARLISLEPSFQSKLGWLVGNIFSRVGTEDWVPKSKTKQEWDVYIKQLLEEHIKVVDDKQVDWTRKNISAVDLQSKTAEEIREIVQQAPRWKKRDDVIDAVVDQIRSDTMLKAPELDKLRRRLVSNPTLKSLLG